MKTFFAWKLRYSSLDSSLSLTAKNCRYANTINRIYSQLKHMFQWIPSFRTPTGPGWTARNMLKRQYSQIIRRIQQVSHAKMSRCNITSHCQISSRGILQWTRLVRVQWPPGCNTVHRATMSWQQISHRRVQRLRLFHLVILVLNLHLCMELNNLNFSFGIQAWRQTAPISFLVSKTPLSALLNRY